MSNLTKPPILDETGQDILSALADIKRNLPQGGGSNGYAPTDATENTLADDDKVPFYDTSASGKRNSTWANIKEKLKAYFDTIYSTFSGAYADLTGKPNLTVYMQKGVDYVTAGQISGQTIGTDATAEGHNVNAYGIYSHAEGDSTSAANNQAHAEGYYTNAMGVNSHAEGFGTKALGANSHAEGKYNVGITGALHEIGNGTNDQNRKNVFAVMDSGKVFASDGDADIGSYADDSDNRVLTFGNTNGTVSDMDGKIRIELTEAEFNQLTQAQKDDPRITYYVTDKPSLGYPIQDDGTATDLTDGALATGRTIENWAKNPTLVSYSDVTIATGITMRFELFSNGTKTVSVGSNTLSNALIQLAAGSIPTIYRPITTGAKYFTGSTSAYETNGTRMIAITPDGRIIIYKSPNAGLYICANYI